MVVAIGRAIYGNDAPIKLLHCAPLVEHIRGEEEIGASFRYRGMRWAANSSLVTFPPAVSWRLALPRSSTDRWLPR